MVQPSDGKLYSGCPILRGFSRRVGGRLIAQWLRLSRRARPKRNLPHPHSRAPAQVRPKDRSQGAPSFRVFCERVGDGGKRKYELQQTIASGGQMWVNLAQLIRNRVPDRKGNVLPVDLQSVTYELRDLTPAGHGLIANAMALDSSFGPQATPGFLRCCGTDDPGWDPDAFTVIIDGLEYGSISGIDQCTGLPVDITPDFTDWWSGNSAVATVSTKQVQGVGAGSTDAYASGEVEAGNGGYCTLVPAQAVAPVTVQVPTASRITQTLFSYSVNSTNFPTCTGTQAGWYRQVQKIVTDQTGADIVLAGQNLSETVTVGTPNNLGITGTQVGTAVTNGNGNFNDTFFVCSSSCPASSGQTNASQTISDVLPSGEILTIFHRTLWFTNARVLPSMACSEEPRFMKLKLILLVLACSSVCTAQQHDENPGGERGPLVTRFNVSGVPAIQALLELSRSENVPLGIVIDDDRLCKTQVSYSGSNVPPSFVVKSIVAQVPGYSWERTRDSTVILVTPISVRPATEQFLNIVDDRYGPIKANLQTLALTLWVHIRYILYPDQGTAGSILGSTNDRIFDLELRDATVQQILNRIAVLTSGTWVLKPLPSTLANLGGGLPFAIFSSVGQVGSNAEDLCSTKVEQSAGR